MQSLWQKPQLRKSIYESKIEALYIPKGRTKVVGPHYGLELEIENASGLKFSEKFLEHWGTHEDHSLHNIGVEFVGVRPFKVEDLDAALASLDATLELNPKLDYSDRASFHLHLNIRDWTIKRWHIFSTIFYLIEDALVIRSGGSKREGNRFCLRLRDAQFIATKFNRFFRHGDFGEIVMIERYANLNHQAYDKFGTLEIRCHRSTRNVQEYAAFIKAIQSIERYSEKVTDVREIFRALSYSGYSNWVETEMPELYTYLTSGDPLKISRSSVAEFVAKSLPLAQEIGLGFDLVEDKEKKPQKKVREDSFETATWSTIPTTPLPPRGEGITNRQRAFVRALQANNVTVSEGF